MRPQFLEHGLCIDHLIYNSVILSDFDNIKCDSRRNPLYKNAFGNLFVLAYLLKTVAFSVVHLGYGFRIQSVNNSVSAFADHLTSFNTDLSKSLLNVKKIRKPGRIKNVKNLRRNLGNSNLRSHTLSHLHQHTETGT